MPRGRPKKVEKIEKIVKKVAKETPEVIPANVVTAPAKGNLGSQTAVITE